MLRLARGQRPRRVRMKFLTKQPRWVGASNQTRRGHPSWCHLMHNFILSVVSGLRAGGKKSSI